MKNKEILVESFKSPYANLLAIVNVIMLVIVEAFRLPRGSGSVTMLVHQANALAILAAMGITGSNELSLFIPPFVYLQWILVVAFAKFLRFHVTYEPL
ncbi:MAG: hypothetical protein HOP17_02590 [Acidobacteria bacterium]|nr:hypothetical protein [Acidobacteriota bacterium]